MSYLVEPLYIISKIIEHILLKSTSKPFYKRINVINLDYPLVLNPKPQFSPRGQINLIFYQLFTLGRKRPINIIYDLLYIWPLHRLLFLMIYFINIKTRIIRTNSLALNSKTI